MIKLVFKYVIPLTILLTVGLVGYNYFWGTAEEKKKSQEIVGKFKDLGSEVVGLLKSEHKKYDEGKFDDALAKISERINFLKDKTSKATDGGKQMLDQLQSLDEQKKTLESQLAGLKDAGDSGKPESMKAVGAEIEALATQTQKLSSSIENQFLSAVPSDRGASGVRTATSTSPVRR